MPLDVLKSHCAAFVKHQVTRGREIASTGDVTGAVSVILKLRRCSRRYFGLNIYHVPLTSDSARRSAVIECSQGFSHMQSDSSWGDDRLLGTALSQTSSISALYPPRAGSCLFRGDLNAQVWHFSGSKLLTFHVYLICLFVCLFSSWRWRNFLTAPCPTTYFPSPSSSPLCLFQCH